MSDIGDNVHDLGDITEPHMAVHMSGDNDLYGSDSEEVIIKKIDIQKDMITRSDLEAIIDDWEERFNKLTEGMRTIERGTHKVHAHMDMVMKDNRARESGQLATNKQIKLIQEGLARFIETSDPAHPTPLRTLVQPRAPKMSTPITPSGAPTRYRSELSFASPVNQTTPVQPTLINTPLTELDLELEAANKLDMKIYGMCSFELIVHGLLISMDTVVVDLDCHSWYGYLRRCHKIAIYPRLSGRNTIRRGI